MPQTEFRETLRVDPNQLLKVITDYEKYPQFVEGCTGVQIEEKTAERIRVSYQVNVMSKDFKYTLDHTENKESGVVEWSLVESDLFKKNNGRWVVKPAGTGESDVTYALDVEFKIPIPGFILSRLVKGSLPVMVKSFEKRAKS